MMKNIQLTNITKLYIFSLNNNNKIINNKFIINYEIKINKKNLRKNRIKKQTYQNYSIH